MVIERGGSSCRFLEQRVAMTSVDPEACIFMTVDDPEPFLHSMRRSSFEWMMAVHRDRDTVGGRCERLTRKHLRVDEGVFGAGISHLINRPYRSNSQARSLARKLEPNPDT